MTGNALLTAQGVSVTLGGRAVLNDISLSLSSGHLVALVGPNGAGKTTLLRALAGLLPSQGEVHVGGDCAVVAAIARACAAFRLSATGSRGALASAGARYRGTWPHSARRHRSVTIIAERR